MSIHAADGSVAMAPLAELDPALTDGLAVDSPGSEVVPVVSLATGPWSPALVRPAIALPFALLGVDGLIVHDLRIADSVASELLGPGDLASARTLADVLVPAVSTWTVVHPSRIALLDARIAGAIRLTPLLAMRLLASAPDQCAG